MTDIEKWEDLIVTLEELSKEVDETEWEDKRPATIVRTSLKMLIYLIATYSEGNREITKDYAMKLLEFYPEIRADRERLTKIDKLLEDVELD